jgi:GxxExxY protein
LIEGGSGRMEPKETVDAEVDRIARLVVNAAFKVHVALGPGLLESIYETCLAYELRKQGLRVRTQIALPVIYEELTLEGGFRIDLLVAECLIVELKAVETLLPVHEAQVLTYLKLSGHRLGLLINFNVPRIKNGIRRLIL